MTDLGVPTTVEAVLDPAWLAAAMDDIDESDRIVSVEAFDTSKTLAEKLRFTVTIERDGATRSHAYCAKAHLDGSPGADIVPEAQFYRDLAPRLSVRLPAIHYAAADEVAEEAVIVMEDLGAAGGRFLSAFTPYDLATVRETLSQLALFHASTWGGQLTGDLPWLTAKGDSLSSRIPVDYLQKMLDDGRGPDVAPELRDAEKVLEAFRRTNGQEITCAIHGDTQSGNAYIDAQGRPSWLDWQVVQQGNWSTDVGYHLGAALDTEFRRAHEQDLLGHYLSELAAFGAPAPAGDEAWEQYARSFAYGYFLWSITSVSSREVVLIHVPRLAAALTDHDTFRRLGVL